MKGPPGDRVGQIFVPYAVKWRRRHLALVCLSLNNTGQDSNHNRAVAVFIMGSFSAGPFTVTQFCTPVDIPLCPFFRRERLVLL